MPNKTIWKQAIITLIILLGIVPLVASALTLEEIKTRLLGILERVSVLKVELERAAVEGESGMRSTLPCLSLGRTLRAGMSGEDVTKLQELLIKARLLAEGKATGYFGALTEAAVKKWQAAQGIVSSGDAASTGFGVVGPKTRAAILTVCKNQVAETRAARERTCPLPPLEPPASDCSGTWEKGRDAAGCLTGYQCIEASTTPAAEPVSATSSITVLQPLAGTIVTGGNTLTIFWQSRNAPSGAGVSIFLVDAAGSIVGEIARNLALSGTYLWRVPQGSTDCSAGENAFDCIEKFARCDGGTSICSLEPGSYVIRATLPELESSSEPFQIAGTAVTDVLRSLVGAPVVPPPSFTFNAATGTSGVNSCVHDGRTYAEGTTLSVPCEAGRCIADTSGYVTGTCTNGLWCIPFTTYCATAFSDIDVSVYQGGGATPIDTSGRGLNCPQLGWRVYLDCSVLPACRTGWNICTAGGWTYDPDQSIR